VNEARQRSAGQAHRSHEFACLGYTAGRHTERHRLLYGEALRDHVVLHIQFL
jgi:hypothetical protein